MLLVIVYLQGNNAAWQLLHVSSCSCLSPPPLSFCVFFSFFLFLSLDHSHDVSPCTTHIGSVHHATRSLRYTATSASFCVWRLSRNVVICEQSLTLTWTVYTFTTQEFNVDIQKV